MSRLAFLRRRLPVIVAIAAAALLASAASLAAHAVVYPKSAAPGSYERYVLRVPNEKDVPTTRVELRVPAGVRVTAFAEVTGWQLEVLTDSAKRITGAVWTGTLAPQRFAELPFIAVNPKDASSITWPVLQTYSSGERVEWTGPAGSRTPASTTTLTAASEGPGRPTMWAAWAGLVLGLVSLGVAMRPSGQDGRVAVG